MRPDIICQDSWQELRTAAALPWLVATEKGLHPEGQLSQAQHSPYCYGSRQEKLFVRQNLEQMACRQVRNEKTNEKKIVEVKPRLYTTCDILLRILALELRGGKGDFLNVLARHLPLGSMPDSCWPLCMGTPSLWVMRAKWGNLKVYICIYLEWNHFVTLWQREIHTGAAKVINLVEYNSSWIGSPFAIWGDGNDSLAHTKLGL